MSLFRFLLRGGTAAEWTTENPVLAYREPGVETDTGRMKLGDGATPWNDLDYASKGDQGPPGEGLHIVGVGDTTADLPAVGAPGDGWVIAGDLYIWPLGGGWENAGPFQGPQGPEGPQGPKGDEGAIGPRGPQGVEGPEGPEGPRGERGPVGPVGMTWRGGWSPSVDYVDDDAVFHQGSSWFAAGDPILGEEPTEASTHWMPLAIRGEQGLQGPRGERGEQGPEGPQGPKGDTGATGNPGPVNVSRVVHTGSWPARPATPFVEWVGPTTPPGAQSGDTWVDTT